MNDSTALLMLIQFVSQDRTLMPLEDLLKWHTVLGGISLLFHLNDLPEDSARADACTALADEEILSRMAALQN